MESYNKKSKSILITTNTIQIKTLINVEQIRKEILKTTDILKALKQFNKHFFEKARN